MTTSSDKLIQNFRRQISEGEIALVLDQLQNYLCAGAPALRDEAILLTARYNRIRRNARKGTITNGAAQAEENKIIQSILELLEDVSEKIITEMAPVMPPSSKAGEISMPRDVTLEKILGVNNLKQIAWFERGLQVSKSVCRILMPKGLGTGFLISPDLLMTNHHVIPDANAVEQSVAEFNYQYDFENNLMQTCRYRLNKNRFHTNPVLDYTTVGVLSDPQKPDLKTWGHVILNPHADPVPGEHVIIIQHPNGGPKQIVVTANQVIGIWEHRLQYTTDTMPGSSGSPVFNDLWQAIAIHHAGGELKVNDKGDKRFINEGILMSAVSGHQPAFLLS